MEVVRWKKRRLGCLFETGSIILRVGRFVVLGQGWVSVGWVEIRGMGCGFWWSYKVGLEWWCWVIITSRVRMVYFTQGLNLQNSKNEGLKCNIPKINIRTIFATC